jgi:sugar/nucleoside kinase (ribokinase family)
MREKPGVSLGDTDIFRGPFASGAPAIFIDAAAMLGHDAAMIGGVGDDDFGKMCIDRLKGDGVDVTGINISSTPTGVAFVAYSEDGDRKYIFHIRDSAASEMGDIPVEKIKEVKAFHIMGCSLMIGAEIAEKITKYAEAVKESGGIISFDPNIRVELMDMDYIKSTVDKITDMTDIMLPGPGELKFLTGTKNIEDAVGKILKKVKILVLKNGKEGCSIYSGSRESKIDVGAFKIDEVDPTGAGDAFDAGFLCAYLEGKEFSGCGVLANACGALNATRLGPMEGIVKRDLVERFIEDNKR